jgi:hypothetical protein
MTNEPMMFTLKSTVLCQQVNQTNMLWRESKQQKCDNKKTCHSHIRLFFKVESRFCMSIRPAHLGRLYKKNREAF